MNDEIKNGDRVVYSPTIPTMLWEFRVGKEGTVHNIDVATDSECCDVHFDGESYPVRPYIVNLKKIR